MTLYQLAFDFLATLLGEVAQTARGQLVCEYFGYIVIGIVVALLVKVAMTFILYPISLLKK